MAGIDDYPLTGYRFQLSIAGSASGGLPVGGQRTDGSFQEVSGISSQLAVEEYKEGGANGFTHYLPLHIKHANLVLKRGVTGKNSELSKWCNSTLSDSFGFQIDLKDIDLVLYDEENKPALGWTFKNAYPVKWEYSALNAQKGEILVQTVELCHQGVKEFNV